MKYYLIRFKEPFSNLEFEADGWGRSVFDAAANFLSIFPKDTILEVIPK